MRARLTSVQATAIIDDRQGLLTRTHLFWRVQRRLPHKRALSSDLAPSSAQRVHVPFCEIVLSPNLRSGTK